MKIKTFIAAMSCIGLALTCALSEGEEREFPTNKPIVLNTLTDQEKANGWELLFNGENLDGWELDENYKGTWDVQDGIIMSSDGPSHLYSAKKYKNFVLSWDVCAYDVNPLKQRFGNSGVFVRGVKSGGAFPKGYEVQVDPYDINNPTGGIYGKAPGNLLVDEDGNWKKKAFFEVHEGKWIHQKVMIIDNHVIVWVNGEITLDWIDPENSFPEPGYIALQNHHSTDVVLFTNIKIKVFD